MRLRLLHWHERPRSDTKLCPGLGLANELFNGLSLTPPCRPTAVVAVAAVAAQAAQIASIVPLP